MKRTIHKTEPPFEPYVVSLAPELIGLLKSGEKVKTYRFGNKYDYLKVGDIIKVIDTVSREFVFNAKIVNKDETDFESLPIDCQGHEKFESKEDQRKVFNGYYAWLGRPIKDGDRFLVLEFERIKSGA